MDAIVAHHPHKHLHLLKASVQPAAEAMWQTLLSSDSSPLIRHAPIESRTSAELALQQADRLELSSSLSQGTHMVGCGPVCHWTSLEQTWASAAGL